MSEIAPQVILYSGGMDSIIMASLFPDALRLYIDCGSAYAAKEKRFLDPNVDIVSNVLNLSRFERPDAIIPGRNLFFALVAAQYGDEILLGATAGDASRDKNDTWAHLASEVLRYMFSGPHFKDPYRHPRVYLPLRNSTKVELVEQYLRAGNDDYWHSNPLTWAGWPDVQRAIHAGSWRTPKENAATEAVMRQRGIWRSA